MDDKIGTFLYLLVLLIIVIVGALTRKKKPPATGYVSHEAQSAEDNKSPLEQLFRGTGIADVLPEQEKVQEKEKVNVGASNDLQINTIPVREVREKEEFLPSEEEGVSAFEADNPVTEVVETGSEKAIKTSLRDIENWHPSYKQEQEKEKTSVQDIIHDFDVIEAVIYSEILSHKYF